MLFSGLGLKQESGTCENFDGKNKVIDSFFFRKLRSCLNKMLEGIEMAPFRSIDEFLTSESK